MFLWGGLNSFKPKESHSIAEVVISGNYLLLVGVITCFVPTRL